MISASLSSGVASARKSSTPASSAIALAVSGLSPVIITVRMPIRRISSNRSRMPCLTTSLRWMTPSARAGSPVDVLGDHQRGAAGAADPVDELADLLGGVAAVVADPLHHRRGGALADPADRRRPSASRSTPDIRVCAVNGTKVACGITPGSRSRSP